MSSIVIGTAGHIDHGKSSLVQALTGKDPDRLPEEKRRGITIDLGFADLDLDGLRVGFVDVPGHERFIKNMLAGVHGIDAVMLVIAADEGVMPQTREHFDICRLLGVNAGLVVLTKTDLVEDELLALVRAEAEELVTGSFLQNAPIISASAKKQTGLDLVREALRTVSQQVSERSNDFVMRLPIDRAFSMKGFGAVVTGTLISGEIADGDEMELLPARTRVRARGVQVHGAAVSKAQAGQRTAVNLAGIDLSDVERGMVLAQLDTLQPTQMLDVRIEVLKNAPRNLKSRTRLRVHLGAAEVLGRLRVLNTTNEIAAGAIGYGQLRLESPVPTVHGDRFILRSYSPPVTIAGGVILDPLPIKHRSKELPQLETHFAQLESSDREAVILAFISAAGESGLRIHDLVARTGLKESVVAAIVNRAKKAAAIFDAEGILLTTGNFEILSAAVIDEVRSHHQREPFSKGISREVLRERLFRHSSSDVFRAIVNKLEANKVLSTDKDLIRATEHSVGLSAGDAALRDALAKIYAGARFEPPTLNSAFERLGLPAAQRPHGKKIVQMLVDDGTLVRVQPELFLHSGAANELRSLLRDYALRHEPDRLIDVPAFKELAGVSRKFAIPLLEYLDRERVTRRAGDRRLIL